MEYILKFRSPNLYTIIIVTKMKKGFLRKKERVKGFFIFMSMLSFKQVKSNNDKKESCKQGCSWIIKFFHGLNFRYRECGIIFSILTQNGCKHCTHKKKSMKWTTLDTFLRGVNFILMFLQEELTSL